MHHPKFTRGWSDAAREDGPRVTPQPNPLHGVRRQAEFIIATVMASRADSDRATLAAYIDAYPGQPELALAQFLREIRPNISDYEDSCF